jgi:hypothetical protein
MISHNIVEVIEALQPRLWTVERLEAPGGIAALNGPVRISLRSIRSL